MVSAACRGGNKPGEEVWGRILATGGQESTGGHEWKAAKAVAVVLPLPTPDTPGNMGSAATGLQQGGVWLGPPGKQGPTYAQETTCNSRGGALGAET